MADAAVAVATAASEAGPAPLSLSIAQVSNIGGRSSNQDAIGSAKAGPLACFVLSDGAGGHVGGEIASATVVDTIIDAFDAAPACTGAALSDWIGLAAADVALGQSQQAELRTMSATVAALAIDCAAGLAIWAHLGDTRLYLFRAGVLLLQTRDHSLVQQLIDAGLAAADASRTHAKRHVLYGAIGVDADADAGITAQVAPPFALQAGDVFLLCTDGLWEWVNEAEMARTLAQCASVADWLDALCEAADSNSAKASPHAEGRDNLTALALRMDRA